MRLRSTPLKDGFYRPTARTTSFTYPKLADPHIIGSNVVCDFTMTRDIRQRVTDQTLVECQGIEPCRPPCKGGMLPLSSAPHYWHQCKDLNLRRTVLETGMLPLHHTDRIGLGGRIRTCGPLRPRQVRYQTSPHLDNGFRATRVPSNSTQRIPKECRCTKWWRSFIS